MMKRNAGLLTTTFHRLGGGNPLSLLFLNYYYYSYCTPLSPHFIFALALVDGCFLFCRNNTPFTSLHSLTSTKIGQSLSRPTQLKEDTREHPHVRLSPPDFLCCVLYPELRGGFHHVQTEHGKGKHLQKENYRNNCVYLL